MVTYAVIYLEMRDVECVSRMVESTNHNVQASWAHQGRESD